MKLTTIIVAAALILRAPVLSSQGPTPVPGDELTVYLMTMGPGDAIFEKFGHTAIWIHDSARQTDVTYNWGLFDFNDKDFIARLARGEMRYWMEGFEMQAMLQSYIATNRSVWAQELNLTPQQKLHVQQLAETNARPENKYYTYDYYRNNCSTLPRDLLDRALGGAIKARTDTVLTNTSFRSHTLRILGDDLLPYAGSHFALGHPADARISQWEEMFLPQKLLEHVRGVSVTGANGTLEPLVVREIQLAATARPPERKAAPNYVRRFTVTGIGIAAILLFLLSLSLTGLRTTKALLGLTASLLSLVGGLAGLGLLLAWTVTDHYFMSRNENILQLTPLLLPLVVIFPLAFKIERLRTAVIGLSLACAALSVAGFALQSLPMFNQHNGEMIGLALPIQVALAFVSWFLFSGKMKRVRL